MNKLFDFNSFGIFKSLNIDENFLWIISLSDSLKDEYLHLKRIDEFSENVYFDWLSDSKFVDEFKILNLDKKYFPLIKVVEILDYG